MTHGKSISDVRLRARQIIKLSVAGHKETSIFKASTSQTLFTFKKLN